MCFFLEEASWSLTDSQRASRPKEVKKNWIQETSGFQRSRRVSLLLPFRCSECQESLTTWYYEKDGKLYCHKDYWEKFGEFCHGCSLLMTGPVMVSESLHLCLLGHQNPLIVFLVPNGQASSGLPINQGLSLCLII